MTVHPLNSQHCNPTKIAEVVCRLTAIVSIVSVQLSQTQVAHSDLLQFRRHNTYLIVYIHILSLLPTFLISNKRKKDYYEIKFLSACLCIPLTLLDNGLINIFPLQLIQAQ
jgi:hypothetical protein